MKRLKIISATSFLLIGVLLFGVIQAVLTPRWIWPHFKESTENMLGELYTLNDSDIQVFFLGPSNSLFAVDPMRIYKNSGIVTYNLSTSAQPLEVSYYVLSEAFHNIEEVDLFSVRSMEVPEQRPGQLLCRLYVFRRKQNCLCKGVCQPFFK